MVDAEVRCDLEQPAGEGVLGVVAVERAERLDEGFLGEIGGLVAVSNHAQADRKHRTLVFFEQRAEGALVTGARSGDELDVLFSQRARPRVESVRTDVCLRGKRRLPSRSQTERGVLGRIPPRDAANTGRDSGICEAVRMSHSKQMLQAHKLIYVDTFWRGFLEFVRIP